MAMALGVLLAACREHPPRGERAIVFASASLAAPFEAVAREFERANPGARVELHTAGTPQLVLQLREGAPADVLATADERSMQRVVESGRVASAPEAFARNRLAIAVAPGNPRGIRGLADLARDDLTVLLCGPEVPAGRYAREALARAGVTVRSASDEPSVRAVVAKVRLGEADAGMVYRTDVAGATTAGASRNAPLDAIPLPAEHDVVARYPIAVLDGGHGRATGEAFVAFVRSERGREVLRSFGFLDP